MKQDQKSINDLLSSGIFGAGIIERCKNKKLRIQKKWINWWLKNYDKRCEKRNKSDAFRWIWEARQFFKNETNKQWAEAVNNFTKMNEEEKQEYFRKIHGKQK